MAITVVMRNNHHLPEHPLYWQVQKTALALEKKIHPFRSVSLGQRC